LHVNDFRSHRIRLMSPDLHVIDRSVQIASSRQITPRSVPSEGKMKGRMIARVFSISTRCSQNRWLGCVSGILGRGQGVQGGRLIEQADVSVHPEGQGRSRVAGEGLDDLDRGFAHCQSSDV
jgi:hypothetical protein